MKRKKLKAVTLAGQTKTVFDLRSEYVVMPDNAAPIEVENPYNRTQKTVVLRALRDDPLGRLEQRGQIDQAQYLAGRTWQRAYETAEISGARAIDPTREHVDGGQIASSAISDEQARAFATLAKASRAVGMIGESVLRDVLANRMFPAQIAEARGFEDSQRATDYYSRLFRDCLETLAGVFGFRTGR